MKTNFEKLAEELRVQRYRNKLTQDEMAKNLEISEPTYRNYEKHPETLNLSQAILISEKLNWNLLQFFLDNVLQNAKKEGN